MRILIKNGKLLLNEGDGFVVKSGSVIVDGKKIEKVVVDGEELESKFDKVIDATNKLVMPGLINAHTHAYMSIFRNYADDLEFFDWLHKVEEVEDKMSAEDCYWASLLSIIEMMKTGTTCFVDMCMRSNEGEKTGPKGAVSGAVNDSGMRAYIGRGLVEEANSPGAQRRLNEFLKDAELFAGNDRVKYILAPHAPYSSPQSLLELIRETGLERGVMATIHIAESDAEVEGIRRDYGMTPVEYVEKTGLFDLPTIAAHVVKATDSDIKVLVEQRVSVAINPRSNMKLGNGFAPVSKMLEAGVNVCLGTDGDGSNNTQNLFQEMNFASLVYKGSEGRAKCVDAEDVVKFATLGGAKALGREGELGVIAEGALADLILLDLTEPEFVPRNDLVSALCYSTNGSEVVTMLVNGEVVMENRKILTFDEEEVYQKCTEMVEKLGMNS